MRLLRALVGVGAALSLAACAALSGLDQITESARAPDCVDDAASMLPPVTRW